MEELHGLMFEERKRQRSESDGPFDKNTCDNMTNNESGFSKFDYSDSSPQFLATLS